MGETQTLRWNPEDFVGVTLLDFFSFNHIDTVDIISEKAVIPKYTEWIYDDDTKLQNITRKVSFRISPTTKSVVMHYLTTEIFNFKEIISLIDMGVVPRDWRIMVAVPKEREFKEVDALCNGKMTRDEGLTGRQQKKYLGCHLSVHQTSVNDTERGTTHQNVNPDE